MDDARSLRTRQIAAFWAPLAATWMMMAVEGPFLAAIIARLPEATYNLAAHGVAYAVALVVEGPVIMMLGAATALVRDAPSYRKLRNFTNGLNALVTAGMLLVLVPPVFDALTRRAMGLPDPVADLVWTAVAILLPWPGAIGFRRFYQGVLIRSGAPRRVAYGTLVRLAAMASTAALLAASGRVAGAFVGAAALSAGVVAEALAARVMARRAVAETLALETGGSAGSVEGGSALDLPGILRFYTPLALTSMLSLGVQPIVTMFVGQSRRGVASLAVLPVVMALVFVFRALGLAYQEVAIALVGDRREHEAELARFAALLGLSTTAGLAAIVATPLADLWFVGVSGLTPELAALARPTAQLLAPLAGLTVLLSWQRAALLTMRTTRPVTVATGLELTVVAAVLAAAIGGLDLVGAYAAGVALLTGRLAANGYLVVRVKEARRAWRSAREAPRLSVRS